MGADAVLQVAAGDGVTVSEETLIVVGYENPIGKTDRGGLLGNPSGEEVPIEDFAKALIDLVGRAKAAFAICDACSGPRPSRQSGGSYEVISRGIWWS